MKIDENISFLDKNKKEFLQKKIKNLTENIPLLEYIILFGSYARADEKATSDIDLLVITGGETERLLRGELCSKFEEENVDLVFYTAEQFTESQCLFVKRVKEEGIVLWRRK